MPISPDYPAGRVARLLREAAQAVRESAAEHSYRADAMRHQRERLLADYDLDRQHECWELADELAELAQVLEVRARRAALAALAALEDADRRVRRVV